MGRRPAVARPLCVPASMWWSDGLRSSRQPTCAVQIRAYQNLEHLQGSCVPRVLGAGSLDRGRTAFIALEDAGMNARDLLQCSSPSRRKAVFSLKVKSRNWSAPVKAPVWYVRRGIRVTPECGDLSHCKQSALHSSARLPTIAPLASFSRMVHVCVVTDLDMRGVAGAQGGPGGAVAHTRRRGAARQDTNGPHHDPAEAGDTSRAAAAAFEAS